MRRCMLGGVVVVGAELALAGSIALGGMADLHGTAQAATGLFEDEPGWSCVEMGNRVCGPDNSNGVVPGCYDDSGVLVAPWPCHVVVNADGSSDVFDGPASFAGVHADSSAEGVTR